MSTLKNIDVKFKKYLNIGEYIGIL